MKICSSCHTLIEDDAVICPNCGAEQRHFPTSKPATPRTKRSSAARKLILPAILVVALMGAILAFALRESDDPPAETTETTTPTTTPTLQPVKMPENSGLIVCENGEGSYEFKKKISRLVLEGTGTLTAAASGGEDTPPWQSYLKDAVEIEIHGFSEIAPETFRGAPNLESVRISPSITDLSIGEKAFADCPKLRKFDIEENMDTLSSHYPQDRLLVQLGDGCFSGCSALTGVYLPSVSEIGKNVFDGVDDLIDFQVSPALGRLDSTLDECYGIILLMRSGEAVDREIFEKLNKIDPNLSVHIDGMYLADLDQCPIKEE